MGVVSVVAKVIWIKSRITILPRKTTTAVVQNFRIFLLVLTWRKSNAGTTLSSASSKELTILSNNKK